jgi:hypothetical protein
VDTHQAIEAHVDAICLSRFGRRTGDTIVEEKDTRRPPSRDAHQVVQESIFVLV